MLGELAPDRTASLAPRAAIALLTLQLRAAMRDAEAAESEEVGAQHDAARVQLRERLDPFIEQRRRALAEALAQAHLEATSAVEAAQRDAAAAMAQAQQDAQPARVLTEHSHGISAAPVSEVPPPPPSSAQASVNLVIDAEAFAKVFATVFATLLDERLNSSVERVPYIPPALSSEQLVDLAAVRAPLPAKPSFWTAARHPDVLLMAAATVIVLVVLAAWLG